jgi:hypothetical protein
VYCFMDRDQRWIECQKRVTVCMGIDPTVSLELVCVAGDDDIQIEPSKRTITVSQVLQ